MLYMHKEIRNEIQTKVNRLRLLHTLDLSCTYVVNIFVFEIRWLYHTFGD